MTKKGLRELVSLMHEDAVKQQMLLESGEILIDMLVNYDEKISLIKHIEEAQAALLKFILEMLESGSKPEVEIVLPEYTTMIVDLFGHEKRVYKTIELDREIDVECFVENVQVFSTIIKEIFKDVDELNRKIHRAFLERDKFIVHTEVLAEEHVDEWFKYG